MTNPTQPFADVAHSDLSQDPEFLDAKWNQAISYKQYIELIDSLLAQEKTTGDNHSEAMIHYTVMNRHRMRRIETYTDLRDDVSAALAEHKSRQDWLVLTEAWCGDAAQSIPVMHLMAEQSESIRLRFLLRDEHPDLMDRFLYKGRSRSIPRLIVLDRDTRSTLGVWGPRPEEAQSLFESMAGQTGISYQEMAEELQKWYAKDRTEAIQQELVAVLRESERFQEGKDDGWQSDGRQLDGRQIDTRKGEQE